MFFGESLPEEFHEQIAEDKTQCDLLIVIGSSLKVRPVSLIPGVYKTAVTLPSKSKLCRVEFVPATLDLLIFQLWNE